MLRRSTQFVTAFLCCMLIGCAGIAKMTPQERALTFCDDFMSQYESMASQSLNVLSDENVSVETKKYVATKINPKINRLKPLIIDYCQLATKGGAPSSDAIAALIADISALFMEAKRK